MIGAALLAVVQVVSRARLERSWATWSRGRIRHPGFHGIARRVATGADAPVAQRAARSDVPRVIVTDDAVRARARASRRSQGLPATLDDPVRLRRLAAV